MLRQKRTESRIKIDVKKYDDFLVLFFFFFKILRSLRNVLVSVEQIS